MEGLAAVRRRSALLFILFPVLSLILLAGCGRGDGPGEDVPAYLVAVIAGDICGSGVIYGMDNENLYVLTASHVLASEEHPHDAGRGSAGEEAGWGKPSLYGYGFQTEDGVGDPVTVRFCDGWEVICTDIVVSGKADLALIRIPVSGISAKRQELYRCVIRDKERFDALEAGDGCAAVGIGADGELIRYDGDILEPWIYMEDYGQYMIWAQAEIRPGMSGGALFDDGGYFIGILSGGNGDGELSAVPLSLIIQFDMEVNDG